MGIFSPCFIGDRKEQMFGSVWSTASCWQLDTFRVWLQGGLLFCFGFLISDVEAQFLLWMCTAWHLATLVHWRGEEICKFSQVRHAAILSFANAFSVLVFFSYSAPLDFLQCDLSLPSFVPYLLVATSISGTEKSQSQVESANKLQWCNWKVIKKSVLLERIAPFPKGFVKVI